MIIGDLRRWSANGRDLPVLNGLNYVDVDDLASALALDPAPEIILSAMFVRDIDAFEIAERLDGAGFAGRYRVVADNIADPALVTAEVAESAPGLDFDIVRLNDAVS